MVRYTKEQMEALEAVNAQYNFDQVVHKQYILGYTKERTETVWKIYVEATGNRPTLNLSCQRCVMNLYKLAGNIYYHTKESAQEETEPIVTENNIEESVQDETEPTIENQEVINEESQIENEVTENKTRKRRTRRQ